jgi:hypothetical protein
MSVYFDLVVLQKETGMGGVSSLPWYQPEVGDT